MESVLLSNALQLVVQVLLPIFGAVLVGALLSGVLRVATQIEDPAVSLAGRLAAVCVFFSVAGRPLAEKLFKFALSIWSGADYYH